MPAAPSGAPPPDDEAYGATVRRLIHQGRLGEARLLFDDLLGRVPQDNDRWQRTAALAQLAAYAWHLRRIPTAVELTADALAQLDGGYPEGPGAAAALRLSAYVLGSIGEYERANEIYRRALDVARRADDPALLILCLQNLGGGLNISAFYLGEQAARRRYEESKVLIEEGLTLMAQHGADDRTRIGVVGAYAVVMEALGHRAGAGHLAGQTLELAKSADSRWGDAVGYWVLSRLRRRNGDLTESRRLATRAVVAAEAHNHLPLSLRVSQNLADVCAEMGDSAGEAAALRYMIAANRNEATAIREGLAQALEQRRFAIGAQQAAADASADAERDPLTGLANRRGLDRAAELMLEQAKILGSTIWLMIIDVDLFKTVNDLAGHIVGDAVLTEIAQLLRAECRGSDLLARWAGDEFVVMLDNSGQLPGAGPAVAERIRASVDGHPWGTRLGAAPGPTISIGVAAAAPGPVSMSAQDLFVAADEALYRAKRGGRNRTEVARL